MAHFEHGALDKATACLVDPKVALQRTPYTCPDCKRDVHLRKGKRRVAHFAHNPNIANPCTYYDRNASRDQQHKNAQLKLKHFLDRGNEIDIARICPCGCRTISSWGITRLPSNVVKCEHRFTFNDSNKSADVAVLDSAGTIVCIFEVVHTHYTREIDRPEPWHEIRADEINAIPSDSEHVAITCVRQVLNPKCIARQAAERRAAEEHRLKREQERREEQAREEEENRKWRERMEKRFREETERWRVEGPEAQLQRRRDAEEKWNREEGPRLLKIQQQRDENRLRLKDVEEDHVQWTEGHPRRAELYRSYASREPTCMLCSSLGERMNSSLGRCKGCNIAIRKLVDKRLQ